MLQAGDDCLLFGLLENWHADLELSLPFIVQEAKNYEELLS